MQKTHLLYKGSWYNTTFCHQKSRIFLSNIRVVDKLEFSRLPEYYRCKKCMQKFKESVPITRIENPAKPGPVIIKETQNQESDA